MDYNLAQRAGFEAVARNLLQQRQSNPDIDHALYVTFNTTHPDVLIPAFLLERYPTMLTLVFQHNYRIVSLNFDSCVVELSFNKVFELITIPWEAITRLYATSPNDVNLLMQSHVEVIAPEPVPAPVTPATDNVVDFATFRKKP